MAISLGSSLASKVYLGATEIGTAYLGATQVYSGFSTEAQSYFDRLDTASDTTYTPYKQPLANYIDGLVALGGAYWTTMETAASFVGVGLEGCLVPPIPLSPDGLIRSRRLYESVQNGLVADSEHPLYLEYAQNKI